MRRPTRILSLAVQKLHRSNPENDYFLISSAPFARLTPEIFLPRLAEPTLGAKKNRSTKRRSENFQSNEPERRYALGTACCHQMLASSGVSRRR